MLERLVNIGFRKVGECKLTDGKLLCHLDAEANSRNILYAFVTEQEVLYIGKTIRPLKSRLYGYQNPDGTQITNVRGNKRLIELLAADSAVYIYVLPDHGLMQYGGFHLNLAAALEDSLISQLKPKWNMAGV